MVKYYGRNECMNNSSCIHFIDIKCILKTFLKGGQIMSESIDNIKFKNKNLYLIIITLLGITSIIGYIYFSKIAYSVSINDKMIGIVSDKEKINKILNEIKDEMGKKYNKEIKLTEELSFKKIKAEEDQITSSQDIKSKLYDILDFKVDSYAINVDGKDLVYLEGKVYAQKLLQEIKNKYIGENEELKEIDFAESVKIKKKEMDINKLISYEDALNYILLGGKEIQKYKVKSGDTAWDIAIKHDLDLQDISKANPNTNLKNLKIGQEISLNLPTPYISVKTVASKEYEDEIPFEVVYEESSNIYIGENRIRRKGEEGKKKVSAELVKINGILAGENVVEEEILKEPVDAIVVKGTKERPKTMAYGVFASPSRGRLTSRFGPRWGKAHEGIDISGSVGTPIKAADGGKVVTSGWINGYGKTIIIDHENGYKTLYAHANSLKVKKGQRVYKGQVIASIGTSGRVTGPNLHFEVQKNGVAKDPLKYIEN